MRISDWSSDVCSSDLLDLGGREAAEIRARFPQVLRRVGGYNLDALAPNGPTNNLAHLLVGSEGTLALSERTTLKLSPILANRAIGVCPFPSLYAALAENQPLVPLGPTAVELVDSSMIAMSRAITVLRPALHP